MLVLLVLQASHCQGCDYDAVRAQTYEYDDVSTKALTIRLIRALGAVLLYCTLKIPKNAFLQQLGRSQS